MNDDRSFALIAEPRDFALTAAIRWDATELILVPAEDLLPGDLMFPDDRTFPLLVAAPRPFDLEAK